MIDLIFTVTIAACLGIAMCSSHRQWKREVAKLERRIEILCVRINRGNLPPYGDDESQGNSWDSFYVVGGNAGYSVQGPEGFSIQCGPGQGHSLAYKLCDALVAASTCGSRECSRKVFQAVAEALSQPK